MRLSKLSIYGFKSFAKRTEVILPGNITAIVGPNGSGKSNIADAVRWVLGEQSAKTLRGNSMQDVIFNGTTQRKAMSFCEVSLIFDNSDGELPVDYQEVTILRRVYRNGDSEYQLNGSPCRLRDIVDLLRDTGVGREGYSIVGQGRIDEILSQRSEDRRAVFEEAAGISRFRSRKEEAEGRLKKAVENLTRVEDVVEELAKLLVPLKSEADAAREYLRLSALLKDRDLRLYFVRSARLREKAVVAEQLFLKLSDTVKETEDMLAALAEDRDKLEGKVSALQEDLSSAHDALLERKDAFFAAKEELNRLLSALSSFEEETLRFQNEEKSLDSRLRLMKATLSQSQSGLQGADEQVSNSRAELEKRKKTLSDACESLEKLEAEMAEHNRLLMSRISRLQDAKTALARQSAMKQALEERRTDVESQLAQGESHREQLAQRLNEAQQSLNTENEQLKVCRKNAEALQEETDELLRKILAKQKALHEGQQNLREKAARLRTLKELQEGYEGFQYPVKNALQYAQKRGMQGVRGVIARLIQVPKEYETALDMALGSAMQNIVTDTQQEAKTLIDYLRENRLGRATFLPIKTVRGRTLTPQERGLLNMEGCLGVASELISFDEEYRGIVESLLGRTLIATDLHCGIPIMEKANHALRLVTLQGDLMNPGGSMTGGSIQQKAQNLLGREREIKELDELVKSMGETLQSDQATLNRWEEERAVQKEKREAASYELHQQEIAVTRDTEHVSSARQELSSQEQRLQSLKDAIVQIDESLAEIAKAIETLEQQSKEADTGNEDLNERTENLSRLLDKARRAKEAAQESVTDGLLLLQSAERDADALQKDRLRLTTDMEDCERQQAELVQRRKELAQRKTETEAAKTQAEDTIARKEQAVQAAVARVEETETRMKQEQDELHDLQSQMESGNTQLLKESEKLHRADTQLNKIKADLETLSAALWHNYELTQEGAEQALAEIDAGRTEDWHEGFDEHQAEQDAESYRTSIRRMGEVNTGAVEEYAKMADRHRELSLQRDDLLKAKEDLEQLIDELLDKMETVFVAQFSELQTYFSECFTRLFGGGYGEISLNDPKDPLNCGIDIIIQPPGKKRQLLSLFSGGERALAAIAILFAMLKLKPTPFCILDEIEAALDDANIATYAEYLKEFSESTQFIVITHRKGTMERCDTLFGVAMQEKGISSLVSVNLTDYEE